MDRQTVPEQELATLPNHGATRRLLDSEPPAKPPLSSSTRRQNSKFQDFLRHIRLLLPTLPWKTTFERRKVAAYQSRRMAVLNSLLHVIPLAVAGTLLGLHWSKYWVGPVSDDATSLQFAAKVHELLMQASLVDILLYIIRSQALNGYLPLGALAGAAQASQLSYLWSLDFFSALLAPSRAFKLQHKMFFMLSTSALLFMTAVVGPSSAILMISRPGMTHVQSTTIRHLDVAEADLFPTEMDETNDLNFARHTESDNSINSYMGDDDGQFRARFHWRSDKDIDTGGTFTRVFQLWVDSYVHESDGGWTTGTLPTILSAQQLWEGSLGLTGGGHSGYTTLLSSGMNWTLQTWQPVVMSACTPSSNRTDNISYVHLDGSTRILQNAPELYEKLSKINESREYSVSWIQMPQEPTSLLALFLENRGPANDSEADSSRNDSENEYHYTVCTVASFWWETPTFLSLTPTADLVQTDWPGGSQDLVRDRLRPIVIHPEGITTLQAVLPGGSELTPSRIVKSFAPALSWISAQDPDAVRNLFPQEPIEGKDWSSIKDPTSYTSFRIVSMINGYGYGGIDTSTQLSLAVIIAYCFITIVYVAYTIFTGHTSIAWNSATELIMLALQSKEPSDFGHISVGIDSMETLRRSVGIRVNTVNIGDTGEYMEKLELVFEHDDGHKKRALKKVERNRAY